MRGLHAVAAGGTMHGAGETAHGTPGWGAMEDTLKDPELKVVVGARNAEGPGGIMRAVA